MNTLNSMTGFGAASGQFKGFYFKVEIKSLNQRYLDISTRLPSSFNSFESEIVKTLKSKIQRGKVEVVVYSESKKTNSQEVNFNENLFNKAYSLLNKSAKKHAITAESFKQELFLKILDKREVFSFYNFVEVSPTEFPTKIFNQALKQFLEMRMLEGKNLSKDLESHLKTLIRLQKEIKKESKLLPKRIKERIETRLAKYLEKKDYEQIDQSRLAQEVAILADKGDISEELSRLESHFEQFANCIKGNGGGRKLEFLLQEFLREFNTIGSKSQIVSITNHVVEAKSVIEKLKEQSANIE